MRLDPSVRRRLKLQQWLFLLLFGLVIGLLAWLSNRYVIRADWTSAGRNTLSAPSQALLTRLSESVHITAYARDNPTLRDAIQRLIERYRRIKPDLTLSFVNPDLLPDRARALGVTLDGELYVEYRGRAEKVHQLTEQTLTAALQRLHLEQDRTLFFLTGHGERNPLGVANYDLGTFSQELEKIGIRVRSVTLAEDSPVLAESAVLVITGPQQSLSLAEAQRVANHVAQGGNLLWLLEPGGLAGLESLAALLGITILPGVVVDSDTSRLGIKNPAFIPVVDYGPHPITQSLRVPTLLPQAVALKIAPSSGWSSAVLLESQASAWTETGPTDGVVHLDPDSAEHAGPLEVAVALSRPRPMIANSSSRDTGKLPQQRLAIVGDGDFLSNTYLGNGANLELGLNLMNWLTLEDVPLIIPPKAASDANLDLSDKELAMIAAIFLLGVPVGLLTTGWLVWFHRRRR